MEEEFSVTDRNPAAADVAASEMPAALPAASIVESIENGVPVAFSSPIVTADLKEVGNSTVCSTISAATSVAMPESEPSSMFSSAVCATNVRGIANNAVARNQIASFSGCFIVVVFIGVSSSVADFFHGPDHCEPCVPFIY